MLFFLPHLNSSLFFLPHLNSSLFFLPHLIFYIIPFVLPQFCTIFFIFHHGLSQIYIIISLLYHNYNFYHHDYFVQTYLHFILINIDFNSI